MDFDRLESRRPRARGGVAERSDDLREIMRPVIASGTSPSGS